MTAREEDGNACPDCGRELPERGVACACGRILPARAYCPRCDDFISRKCSACPTCGGAVQPVPANSRKKLLLNGAIHVAVGAAAMGLALFEGRELMGELGWFVCFWLGAVVVASGLFALFVGLRRASTARPVTGLGGARKEALGLGRAGTARLGRWTQERAPGSCSNCGRKLPLQGIVCECGSALPARVYCPWCSELHARDYSACPACGHLVRRVPHFSRKKLLATSAAFVAVGGALVAFLLLKGSAASELATWVGCAGAGLAVTGLYALSSALLSVRNLRRMRRMSPSELQRHADKLVRGMGYTPRGLAVMGLLHDQLGVAEGPLPRVAIPVTPFPKGALYGAAAVLLSTGSLVGYYLLAIHGNPLFSESVTWLLRVLGAIVLITLAVTGWYVWRWRRRRRRVDAALARAEAELEGSAGLPEEERREAAVRVARALVKEFGAESRRA